MLTLLLITWGVRSLKHLQHVPPAAGSAARVTIVVAARDEASTIERALHSLLAQDYAHYEVIVVNDRSADGTGAILDRVRLQHARLQVIHVDSLPTAWLGKNHALQLAATRATGDYLLFTDADVVMAPSAIARAVAYMDDHQLDHIAVFPEIPAPGYWTAACFALFGLGFLMLTQPWFVRNGRTPMAIGIGAFNFVRAARYRDVGGHARIALRPDDDVALAHLLRAAGARQDILIGRGLISVAWYSSLGGFVRGLEKNAFAPLGYSLPKFTIAMTLHFAAYVVPWIGLFLGGTVAMISAWTITAQMLALAATHSVADQPWRYAPVMLVSSLVFEYAVIRSVCLTLRHGGIRWRETFYALDLLRSNTLKVVALVSMTLAACEPSPDRRPVDPPSANARDTLQRSTSTDSLISPHGIGLAAAGLTMGQLRALLPPSMTLGTPNAGFMVDIVSIAVIEHADTLYHLLFPAGTSLTDDTPLELVATLNTKFRTSEGVGPGTPLNEAAGRYGEPTLSYSVNDESREYAIFPRYAQDNVLFRVTSASDGSAYAGVYAGAAEFNQTRQYHATARVSMVLVDLRTEFTR